MSLHFFKVYWYTSPRTRKLRALIRLVDFWPEAVASEVRREVIARELFAGAAPEALAYRACLATKGRVETEDYEMCLAHVRAQAARVGACGA